MCQQLAAFRTATVVFAEGFDPAVLSLADAKRFVAGATTIENAWAAMKAVAAARVADCGPPGPAGQRQAAEELARTTGITVGGARGTIERGRKLQTQPKVAAAASRGELSTAQSSAIADAAAADPDATDRLLDTAANTSLPELRDECARTQAAAEPDPDRRHHQIHAQRSLRAWTDAGGVGHLHGRGNVEDIAQIMAAVAPIADALFDQARRQSRREPSDAYAFDALVELAVNATSDTDTDTDTGAAPPAGPAGTSRPDPNADSTTDPDTSRPDAARPARPSRRHPTPCDAPADPPGDPPGDHGRTRRKRRGAPVNLQLRVDWDTWLRGVPVDGETCELVGYGPVSMAVVEALVAQGDPFVTAILTRGQAVAGVVRLGRKPTADQRSAVEWINPTCAVRGCTTRAHLQIDHRIEWQHTHFTLLDLLDRLCIAHHNMKTRDGWGLIDGVGKRPFVPPDDPRHPRHTRNPPPARPPAPR